MTSCFLRTFWMDSHTNEHVCIGMKRGNKCHMWHYWETLKNLDAPLLC